MRVSKAGALGLTFLLVGGCREDTERVWFSGTATQVNATGLAEGGTPPFTASTMPPGIAVDTDMTYRALPPVDSTDVVDGNIDFALTLMRATASNERNWVISPFSFLDGIAMLDLASGESVREGIRRAMRFPADGDTLHYGIGSLASAMAADSTEGAELSLARQFFIDDSDTPSPEFVHNMMALYGTAPRRIPIRTQPQTTRNQINAWIAAESDGLIPELFKSDDFAEAVFAFVSVLYFIAEWENEMRNESAPFTLLDGSVINAPFFEPAPT